MPQSSTISIGMYVHLEIPSAGRAPGKVRGDGVKSSFVWSMRVVSARLGAEPAVVMCAYALSCNAS